MKLWLVMMVTMLRPALLIGRGDGDDDDDDGDDDDDDDDDGDDGDDGEDCSANWQTATSSQLRRPGTGQASDIL